jgi:hypothetical protein
VSFEPFGERLGVEKIEQRSRASRTLTRVGAGLFWTLAAVIVTARAIYFQPGIFDGFNVVAWTKSLTAIF